MTKKAIDLACQEETAKTKTAGEGEAARKPWHKPTVRKMDMITWTVKDVGSGPDPSTIYGENSGYHPAS